MEAPQISLIIPAYNEEKYIRACLEHVLKHSDGKFFEIIVIDNASSDKTSEIAREFSGVRVVHEKRKGLTRARQRGFEEATGELLAYIDADTRLPQGWVYSIIEEFAYDKNLASLSGPYIYYDISRWQQLQVKLYWNILAMPLYFIVGYMVVGGNFVIRKDILQKMSGFDTSISFYGEDTNIARRAQVHGKVKFKPSFAMHTSGRRFAGQGLVKTSLLYIINALSELIRHKPATHEYTNIR
jgi:glycosyltransferase involved in cell wall biosynthesis